NRLRTAPPPRHLHRRRLAGEPASHAVHDAGDLHLFRPPERTLRLALGRPAPRAGRTMSFSSVFVRRPIATTLLTIGFALAGIAAFFLLPVASLPNVDIPTIFVTASMAGASPETMSTSVATPLERHLGSIADVTEMTSQSS